MKYFAYIMLALTVLTVMSCDRFKHTFEPADTIDFEAELFTPLANAFQNITAADASAVMSFYAEDYLHNGQYKSDRETWFLDILTQYPSAVFTAELLQSQAVNDSLAVTNWQFTALDGSKGIVADSTFLGERLLRRNGSWLLYGNGDDCGCNPVITQRAIIEYFTFKTCPNCPIVEELLDNLYLSYANQMTYLEYHLNDPMAIPANYNLFQYYGLTNMPVTIFQGQTIIYGNNEDNEAVFTQLVQNLSSQPAKIGLTELQHAVVGNNLSGTVRVELKDTEVTQENLRLKYVIMEKVSDIHTNAAGVPCKNVVLASGFTDLSSTDLQQPVSFSMDFSGTLPSDAFILVWAQKVPATFDFNATIYHALETQVVLPQLK
jgi:hypothetical protein